MTARGTVGLLLVLGATTALTPTVASVPTASWMARVRNDTPVHQLVLPGTHDASARRSAVAVGDHWVLTQSWTIAEQLEHGIRYLDLRVGLCEATKDRLCMYHGSYYLQLTFQDVVEAMGAFLEAHPTEGLAIRLKVDKPKGMGNFQTLVEDSYLKKSPGLWLPHDDRKATAITMKDLRGKVLIFWNSGDQTSRWGFSYREIDDRGSWEFKSYNHLVNGFRDRATKSSSAEVTGWFENPTSGLVYPWGSSFLFQVFLKSVKETAKEVLPRAIKVLKETPMFKGIVSMDFPTQEIIDLLIDLSLSRYGTK